MKRMYAITWLGPHGRTFIYANQGRNFNATREEAEQQMELLRPSLPQVLGEDGA